MVTSFSRTAAAEIAGRGLGIPPNMVGTLHSHCFRALGAPKIAEAEVDEWNLEYPQYTLTPASRRTRAALDGSDDEDESNVAETSSAGEGSGDQMLADINRLRGQMVPEAAYNLRRREFRKLWEAYKQEMGLLDFTDLIDRAYQNCAIAPNNPAVLFVDEAQDLTPLQFALVRRWGAACEYFILAGDDDQLIFPHLGCKPEGLIEPELPPGHTIVLKQSWRIPLAVHQVAERWISQVSVRQPKEYLPREEEGSCEHSPIHLFNLDYYERTLDAAYQADETTMFLTTCNYQLGGVINWLRSLGMPFHNPYRRSNGAWNPLSRKPGSSVNRILGLAAAHPTIQGGRPWSRQELHLLVDWMRVKDSGLRHGAKALIAREARADPHAEVPPKLLAEIFEEDAIAEFLAALEAPDLEPLLLWWRIRLAAEQAKRTGFPAEIALQRGLNVLSDPPKVIVGTIHSVKGGEADHVVLFPDLSPKAAVRLADGGEARDGILRQFYVGMTRARRTLALASPVPTNRNAFVSWNGRYRHVKPISTAGDIYKVGIA